MATYAVNLDAVAHARRPIDARQYVLDSDLGQTRPDAAAQNAYLERHGWDEYAAWHPRPDRGGRRRATKARYAFGYGDFRRGHRTGLIACVYRASEWRVRWTSNSPPTTCCSIFDRIAL